METSIKSVDGQLICQKYNHNDKIILLIMEDSIPFTDRFLCNKCLQIQRGATKITPINTVIDVMREKIVAKNAQAEEQRQTSINELQQFQQKINEIIKTRQMNNGLNHFRRIYNRRIQQLYLKNMNKQRKMIKQKKEFRVYNIKYK